VILIAPSAAKLTVGAVVKDNPSIRRASKDFISGILK
jgi:hypothetical protein